MTDPDRSEGATIVGGRGRGKDTVARASSHAKTPLGSSGRRFL
jgi:hypothetical protein